MTRGRAWIGVLGVLLAGIVALNVFTLSLTADGRPRRPEHLGAGKGELDPAQPRRAALGLGPRPPRRRPRSASTMAAVDEVASIEPSRDDVAVAAQRLAAAGTGY